MTKRNFAKNNKKSDLIKDALPNESITDITDKMARIEIDDDELWQASDFPVDEETNWLDSDDEQDSNLESATSENDDLESSDDIPFLPVDPELEEEQRENERKLAAEQQQEENHAEVYLDMPSDTKRMHNWDRYRDKKNPDKISSKHHRLEQKHDEDKISKNDYLTQNFFKKPNTSHHRELNKEATADTECRIQHGRGRR